MPATEQTWRDQKLMHLVFAVTSVLLLVATLLTFYADYNREWKGVQRQATRIENTLAQYEVTERETLALAQDSRQKFDELLSARVVPLDAGLIDDFVEELKSYTQANQHQVKTILDKLPALSESVSPADDVDTRKLDSAVKEFHDYLTKNRGQLDGPAGEERRATQEEAIALREEVLEELQGYIARARFTENDLARTRKFRRADLDVARSEYDIQIRDTTAPELVKAAKDAYDAITNEVDQGLTPLYQSANTHRKNLESLLGRLTAAESRAKKAHEDKLAEVSQLRKNVELRMRPERNILTLPILDAFGSPLQIKQIWLPELTLNNNFIEVARFDRCTTCHAGIDKTGPNSAVNPGYPHETRLTLTLATPAKAPDPSAASPTATPVETERLAALSEGEDDATATESLSDAERLAEQEAQQLAAAYGLVLAEQGLLSASDVTVSVVYPESAASRAQVVYPEDITAEERAHIRSGLRVGDVIEAVGDARLTSRAAALQQLLKSADWGKPLTLTVRRGLPHPFATHPRLDLFLGSLSPHKTEQFGCTICHQGQGSATAFKFASHTPNTVKQHEEWSSEHGWFHNEHWIQPMHSKRFVESSCLQCHHEVVELEPSERFPDPPAPKLVEGYQVIRQYGCYGCHEINGYDGPKRRVGPDLRTEPNYAPAALQLLTDTGLSKEAQNLARAVVKNPEDHDSRRKLVEIVSADIPKTGADAPADAPAPALTPASHKMANVLADVDSPGKLRKAGPSLRYLGSKVGRDFLLSWIANPFDFREDTKMPRFFGLHSHLGGGEDHDNPSDVALEFEPIEVAAATAFLLEASQPFEYAIPPRGITEVPSAERGKTLFQLRGCLACHTHKDFPEATNTQGPNLSKIGDKLALEQYGRRWLYSWVREPSRYHARTKMPDVFLEPIKEGDKVTDPAADVTEYLMKSSGWEPKPFDLGQDGGVDALKKLARLHLRDKFTQSQAERYLRQGISPSEGADLKGDEALLVGEPDEDEQIKRLLLYVGRRTVAKYGCAGCHDIPGFEDAKPIGTGLADWARKDLHQLAFEQIDKYIAHHSEFADQVHGEGDGHHELDVRDLPEDTGIMLHSLLHHQREGFLWQKLREPRSYDYEKTGGKGYNERLRMPRFALNKDQVESAMTFVLGLVAKPPAAKFVYQPDPRQKAIVEGRKVLEKFNCGGCHKLEVEKLDFEYDPAFEDLAKERPFSENEYSIFRPTFTPKELAASRTKDIRGMGHGRITATRLRDKNGVPYVGEDDDERPLHNYLLWRPAAINGQPFLPKEQVVVRPEWVKREYPAVGGHLAEIIQPVVLAMERKNNPTFEYDDSLAWIPPPLIHEGWKVQPDWLHAFMMDPYRIRPAVVLRMPKFNLSPAEASALASYFRAVDGVEEPYEFDARTRDDHLAEAELKFNGRLDDALRIVTNGNYCVKCHLVGDYEPKGTDRAKGPQLSRVGERLRPEYLYQWLANPGQLLPYTKMPVNFPLDQKFDPSKIPSGGQLIHEGTTPERLEAVVDFITNYDRYMKGQISIKPLVVEAPAAAPGAAEPKNEDGAAAPDPVQPATTAVAADAQNDDNPAPGGDASSTAAP